MNRLRWFLLGAFSLLALVLLAGVIMLQRTRGFSAREQPGAAERWITGWIRATALPADVKARANPVPKSPEALADASAHWEIGRAHV